MAWWREARFGMFIHWGLYAVPAGVHRGVAYPNTGEWIMNDANIPVAEYADYAKGFDPRKFDAEAWVAIAKSAGMKYLIVTAKHHDGFAMFGSRASSFNIVDATPFHRDPVKELAAACARAGLRFGIYYSQSQDWHHAGGLAYKRGDRTTDHWDAAQLGSYDDYLDRISIPQLRELLTNYGPVSVLWFDTPGTTTPAQAARIHEVLKLQPGIITNNRLEGGFPGDTETPEQFVPATGYPGRDWETCMTINRTWGYKSADADWKSPEKLIRTLVETASKGGNFLLNVGPDASGEIPAASVERLQAIGDWMRVNGAAIHGTRASPFPRLGWGCATRKDGTLFLHVFDWPKDGQLTVPMRNAAKSARLLAAPATPLSMRKTAAGLVIDVPSTAPDPIATVIAVEPDGPVDPLPPAPIAAGYGGIVTLRAAEADLPPGVGLQGDSEKNLAGWEDAAKVVAWNADFQRPGRYRVGITYSIVAGREGSDYEIAIGDQKIPAVVQATGGWEKYRTDEIGSITVAAPGARTVTLRCTKKAGPKIMNVRSVVLTPEE